MSPVLAGQTTIVSLDGEKGSRLERKRGTINRNQELCAGHRKERDRSSARISPAKLRFGDDRGLFSFMEYWLSRMNGSAPHRSSGSCPKFRLDLQFEAERFAVDGSWLAIKSFSWFFGSYPVHCVPLSGRCTIL